MCCNAIWDILLVFQMHCEAFDAKPISIECITKPLYGCECAQGTDWPCTGGIIYIIILYSCTAAVISGGIVK